MHRPIAVTASSLFLAISVALVPRATQPIGWSASLEPWLTYHNRYLALGCASLRDTAFFDSCCHPLPASQTAANLPPQCNRPPDDDDDDDAKVPDPPAPSVVTGGHGTYFLQKGNPGACGIIHKDTDLIAAMDQDRYNSGLCGKRVFITNLSNGKTVTVTIEDDCPTCINSNSIDLSKGAFEKLDKLSVGFLNITWYYIDS